jgi:hypothetical protein
MRAPAGTVAFSAALALTGIIFAGAAAGLGLLMVVPGAADPLRGLPVNTWWFRYSDAAGQGSQGSLWCMGAVLAAACICVVASLRSRALYGRGSSPILPFLMLFLFSLDLECLRAGTAILYVGDRSIAASLVLTRIIYWGRFVGLLSLLCAGLYSIELKYRHFLVLAGVVFLVSFAMAAYIPMDRTIFLAQLTWKLGDEQSVWFVNSVIGILAVATAGAASLTRRDRRYLWLALGLALLLVSRELLFFAVHPLLLAVGLVSLAGGIFLCLRTLSVIHRQMEDLAAA